MFDEATNKQASGADDCEELAKAPVTATLTVAQWFTIFEVLSSPLIGLVVKTTLSEKGAEIFRGAGLALQPQFESNAAWTGTAAAVN